MAVEVGEQEGPGAEERRHVTRLAAAPATVRSPPRQHARIAERVPPGLRRELEHLLDETVDAGEVCTVDSFFRVSAPGGHLRRAERVDDASPLAPSS